MEEGFEGEEKGVGNAYEQFLRDPPQHLPVADRLRAVFCGEGDVEAGFFEGLVWDCCFCFWKGVSLVWAT